MATMTLMMTDGGNDNGNSSDRTQGSGLDAGGKTGTNT